MPLMTKAEYAALGILQDDGSRRPVNKSYISKASIAKRLEGAMEFDSATKKMLINSDKADEILRETKDPSRSMSHIVPTGKSVGGKAAQRPQVGQFEAIKTDAARVKLEHDQIDLAERKGQVVSVREVIAAVSASAQIIQNNFKSRNRRLADKVSTMKDAGEIAALMDEEDRVLLQQCSDDFLRRLPTIQIEGDTVTAH